MPSGSHPADFRRRHAVETPEHVMLELELAGVGSRALAALADTAILVGAALALTVVSAVLASRGLSLGPLFGAVFGIALLVVFYGYFALFEGLRAGQTPGKRLVGIRVLLDTGHPVTFGAAALRNLLRVADALPPPYLLGGLLVALHPRHKRLGDIVAGTIVVRDRPAERAGPLAAAPAEARPAAPTLADAEFALLGRFLERAPELEPAARSRLAAELAGRFAGRLPAADPLEGLLALHAAEAGRRSGTLGGRHGAGAVDRFVARQGPRWEQFESLASRAARAGLDTFRGDELPDFAARYREVAADLARARTYGAEPAVVQRLERAVAAGHNVLYRGPRSTWRGLWTLLAGECPGAVVAAWRVVLLAFLLFSIPAAVGFRLVREQPALAAELLPEVMLRRAESGGRRIEQGRRYISTTRTERPALASYLIANNVRVAFLCFAGGIFLGVGSLVLLAFNGFAIGTAAGHFANRGLLGYLLEFIVGHGVLELFAIWVAGAAGFLLGRAIFVPGDRSRGDALLLAGRGALRMLGAVVVLLVVAGVIEGFVSAGDFGLGTRLAVSGSSVLFLVWYLARGALRRSRGEWSASGSPAPRSPAGWRPSPDPVAPR